MRASARRPLSPMVSSTDAAVTAAEVNRFIGERLGENNRASLLYVPGDANARVVRTSKGIARIDA